MVNRDLPRIYVVDENAQCLFIAEKGVELAALDKDLDQTSYIEPM